MAIKEIRERANKERRKHDHIGWKCQCRRCGIVKFLMGDEVYREYGDAYKDVRGKEWTCDAPNCMGSVKVQYQMSHERTLHLNDIKRR